MDKSKAVYLVLMMVDQRDEKPAAQRDVHWAAQMAEWTGLRLVDRMAQMMANTMALHLAVCSVCLRVTRLAAKSDSKMVAVMAEQLAVR